MHIAFSYDEEIGCRGVGHLIERSPRLRPAGGLHRREPTEMQPVLSHKGKQALEAVIEGRAGHSSNPALGENALYPAAEFLLFIRDRAARLAAEGPFDARFSPPHATLQAGSFTAATPSTSSRTARRSRSRCAASPVCRRPR